MSSSRESCKRQYRRPSNHPVPNGHCTSLNNTDIPVLLSINCNHFWDSWTFPLALSSCQNFSLSHTFVDHHWLKMANMMSVIPAKYRHVSMLASTCITFHACSQAQHQECLRWEPAESVCHYPCLYDSFSDTQKILGQGYTVTAYRCGRATHRTN